MADEPTGLGSEAPPPLLMADVYVSGARAATLTKWPDRVEFAYVPDYLDAGGQPAATSLPLSETPAVTRGGAVPAFLRGSCPKVAVYRPCAEQSRLLPTTSCRYCSQLAATLWVTSRSWQPAPRR